MNFVLQPWQLLVAILVAWSNRQQQDIIEYLRTENQVLKEQLGKRRILLSDDQRRRLASWAVIRWTLLGGRRVDVEPFGCVINPAANL
jgi:hypothetical protein